MSNFEKEQENMLRKVAESREAGFENKESKENQEGREMGAKERMEQTVVEVKNTKQRMKNIMVNMQQVIQAVRQIRQQLGLNEEGEVPAVQKDRKSLDKLRKKLVDLKEMMNDLKLALHSEEVEQLSQANPNLSQEELDSQATERVQTVLASLQMK